MEIPVTYMVLVPVVMGLVEALKKVGMSTRYAPLVSVVLGVLGVYVATDFVVGGMVALEGVVIGLTAAGLYSGVKTTVYK